ncbi:MAG: hypothetical protein Q4G67_11165 [Actinomycetia bacterium]|nr:hypothetical protein [Actinomycetes bacterium]
MTGLGNLDRKEILRLLSELDKELAQQNESVVVYVVVGANIAIAVDQSRTTADIDVVVKSGHDQMMKAASRVAAREPDLPADWINSDFTGGDNPTGGLFWQWFDRRDEDDPTIVRQGSALIVEAASPQMMLALKTLGNREQDLSDTYQLMRLTNIMTPEGLGKNLARFTGPRIFQAQSGSGLVPCPRIDPTFAHIFDNAPPDIRQAAEQLASKPTQVCGLVKVTYRNGVEVSRTKPCIKKQGHRWWHKFGGSA